MNTSLGWDTELSRFLAMNQLEKVTWLSRLIFFVSMFARETYNADSNGVENPSALRSYNELVHRIASQQLKISRNESNRMPEDQFFEMLVIIVDELGINANTLLEKMQ